MDITTEKFNELLKLLNNCRTKLHALYNAFVAGVLSAKSNNQIMGQKLDELYTLRDDLTGLTNAITLAVKESRDKIIRITKPKIADLKVKIQLCKDDFKEAYNEYNTALDECIGLKSTYKKEVAACCNTYNIMNKNIAVDQMIQKGYRQQVKLIRAILDKIQLLVDNYNNVKDNVVAKKLTQFDNIYGLTDTLAKKLI